MAVPNGAGPARRRNTPPWPGLAVVALLVITLSLLVFQARHPGDPPRMRRELRKF